MPTETVYDTALQNTQVHTALRAEKTDNSIPFVRAQLPKSMAADFANPWLLILLTLDNLKSNRRPSMSRSETLNTRFMFLLSMVLMV